LGEGTVPPPPIPEDDPTAALHEEAPPYQAPKYSEIDRILELVKNQNEY
jgi:hypothetical protein